MPSSTIEDYVKQVYLIRQQGAVDIVPMGQLSVAMGITPGTTTTMVKAMADAGLIDYTPRIGVKLTEKGEALALQVLRRHRIAEAFLVNILGMDWAEVHDEAERWEHVLSPRVLDRMDALLNRPTHDPHGDPIPAGNGAVKDVSRKSLADMTDGQRAEVSRILDQSQEFLTFIRQVGLAPGVSITVLSRHPHADSILIKTKEDRPIALSLRVAAKIAVMHHKVKTTR